MQNTMVVWRGGGGWDGMVGNDRWGEKSQMKNVNK